MMSFSSQIREFSFESKASQILPGASEYTCAKHKAHFVREQERMLFRGENIFCPDLEVLENKKFSYQILCPSGATGIKRVILMFHGFNEKDWAKYLPWAEAICASTGSSVLMFPIAFHMQRAPKLWSNPRAMYALCKDRKLKHPLVNQASLSNVAISMRIHTLPQRFIWSGLQSYYDVIQLLRECKLGVHPLLNIDTQFDIFAYSIGGFLALTLKLCNFDDYFKQSRVCLFCSGAYLKDLAPVSKFILDSEAYAALYAYVITDYQKHLHSDNLLQHFMGSAHPEGQLFSSLFETTNLKDTREHLLKQYARQIYAISLSKDSVIPAAGIRSLLHGDKQDIDIRVDELDFDREYTHEDPFSFASSDNPESRQNFEQVFQRVCEFYRS